MNGVQRTFPSTFIFVTHVKQFLQGISLVDESEPVDDSRARVELAPGIHAAYDLPAEVEAPAAEVAVDTGLSLEELMAQMKSIWETSIYF